MYHELEYALETKYGLKEAIVIDVDQPESRDAIQHHIGLAAGEYFLRIIKPGDIVGLAWGRTMYEFVSSIHSVKCENVHIVQLLGGLGPPESNVHSSAICSRLAYSLGCPYTLLPSPGVAGSLESKGAFLSDSYVSNALDLIKKVNLAFVSVGNAAEDCLAMLLNIITPKDRLYLINSGAVGDIDLRYYDIVGNPVHSNFDERVIGADLEQFKQYDRVVGLAGGDEKYEAIQGVLNGKYINVLITNYQLARKLVEN